MAEKRSSEANRHDAVAEGLWQRVKEMAMARKRLENFVFSPDADLSGQKKRWVDDLIEDEQKTKLLATEMTLRAFRMGVEGVNYKILALLQKERAITISRLADSTGLPELIVGERVSDLVQVGLASRDMENDQVQATLLTDSLVKIVEGVVEELSQKIRHRMREVVEK
ncbi:MAG: hypothetical protein HY694_06375 [Deltaproteobacteria bacterium]|nr:hypothetical protein [Deltaproteobacteria bacterium]